MVEQIIVAWSRQSELTEGEHLLNGYFELKARGSEDERSHFIGVAYAKLMGAFAKQARENPKAALFVLRLDQEPQPVLMPLQLPMAALLREDPVLYIKATSPPARMVKLKIDDGPKLSKIQENIDEVHVEPWQRSPIPGGYETVAESFGDDVYCRVSGALVECPSCGRWASSKLLEDGKSTQVSCASCLFEDVFTLVVGIERSWAVLPTEALLQNTTLNGKRFFIPRAWNKGGPWIKTEKLKQRYETFCKERNDVSQCATTSRSDDPPRAEGG